VPSTTWNSSTTWPAPSNLLPGSVRVQTWGFGGAGANGATNSHSGSGGGGGSYGEEPALGGITPGSTTLTITITSGSPVTVTGGSVTVQANNGGNGSSYNSPGSGGAASSNTIAYAGTAGSAGINGTGTRNGGAGGAGAGPSGTGTGGAGGAGGTGPTGAGGAGTLPGGGGGGGSSGGSGSGAGAAGGGGQVTITWSVIVSSPYGYLAAAGVMQTAAHTVTAFKGYLALAGSPPRVTVCNAWSGTFAQPASFQTTPPMLQSVNVALTPANSVGGGTGYASAGNWLFCVVGFQPQPGASSPVTVGCWDDIHSFWRPGDVTASNWAVSSSSGTTRTAAWYTANLLRQPTVIYVSPSGSMAGLSCLVLEVQGLGPWDTVTGIDTNYANAAMSLSLSLAAPSSQAFLIAAVCGDSTSAGQSFAPSGWNALPTVTADDGSDHVADAVLTSAWTLTSGSVSVSASASSDTDLSGVIIGVLTTAPAPFPASGAPKNWPQRVIYEVALNAGLETPPDECTWTKIHDSEWAGTWQPSTSPETLKRFWAYADRTGVPYMLGQYQSSSGDDMLDNSDAALSPWNSAGPWYGLINTGNPVRLRMAIGTIVTPEGSIVHDRWYVHQRNALKWPEMRTSKSLRGYVPMGKTDVWGAASAPCPSPYRGEVYQDLTAAGSGWWWPMDDQPGAGGVLPVTLRNAGPGKSSAVLNIVPSSGGVIAQHQYSSGIYGTGGTDLTALMPSNAPPSIAVYSVGSDSGWMYGDPASSPAVQASAGGPVTAQPGAAAWQQTGALGNTGGYGWSLVVNDPTFPSLADGVTIMGWANYAFLGSAQSFDDEGTYYQLAAQPYCPLTVCTLATNSTTVCELQLDTSGHLSLTGGGTVYGGSDLRNGAWVRYTIWLTSTTWEVLVNGGITASASGTGSFGSSFSWFLLNGDFSGGGGNSSGASAHGGNVEMSHWIVYPGLLPKYRETAHCCAAWTGFGLIPAPTSVSAAQTENLSPTGFTPDGTKYQGSYGSGGAAYALSAVAAAVIGSYTSGPSARGVVAGAGIQTPSDYSSAVWTGWTAVAPQVNVYTSAQAATETEAATCLGSGDTFTGGYGSGATGAGVCQTGAGSGASPPSAPSSLGDSVAARLERIAGYGLMTYPGRCIDYTADEPCQAALDVGGQVLGANAQNIVSSDNGAMFVSLAGNWCYRSRPHLNADTVAWQIGIDVIAGMIPFLPDIQWTSDTQRLWNLITVQPYSPDGASLPDQTPANYTAVQAAIRQYGPRPNSISSYLQSTTAQQAQANWLQENFGTLQRRAQAIAIDAASHPAAFGLWAALNVTDLIQVTDLVFGQPQTVGTYRVSNMTRSMSRSANGTPTEAKIIIVADPVVTYWAG